MSMLAWAAPVLALAMLVAVPHRVKNRDLAQGIELFDALDYPAALSVLTRALDQPSSKRDSARIHLYIGLIQQHYKKREDAANSFTLALDYDPRLKPPKNASREARALFMRIRRERLGARDAPRRSSF
jgi:hypothetical protein